MPPVKRKKRPRPPAPSAPLEPASPDAASTRHVGSSALDELSMDLADQLHSAAIHLLRRLRVRDRESGIGPAQLSALSVLVFGGPRSLGELADAEQVRPPTMSRIVAGLHRAHLIRRRGTEDGRRILLTATPRGIKLMWAGRQRRVELLARALGSLPADEKKKLREAAGLLRQIIRDL